MTRANRLQDDPLLFTELTAENHTRFDYPRAVPTEDVLQIQFTALAIINAIVAAACFIIVISILRNKSVRNNPFNLYLLWIATPDFLNSFFCMLTCSMSAPQKEYYSEMMCGFQSFYLVWGYTSNCWMNGVIVYQIHKLLRHSHIRRRYMPPSRRHVMIHASIVYTYATFWGLLGVWNISWLPHKTSAFYGFACFPIEYDLASTIFWWLLFAPAFLMLPILYVVYVIYDIWKRDLLPKQGRRRNLSIYFFRLIFVYFFMWTPSLVICLVGNFVKISPWVYWAGAAWSHLQGLASSLATLTKPDIKEAVFALLFQCKGIEDPNSAQQHNAVTTTASRSRISDMSRSASLRISLMQSFKSLIPSFNNISIPNMMKSRTSLDTEAAQKGLGGGVGGTIKEETPSQANGTHQSRISSVLGRTTIESSLGGLEHSTTHNETEYGTVENGGGQRGSYDNEDDDVTSVNSEIIGTEFSPFGRPSRRVTFTANSNAEDPAVNLLALPSGDDDHKNGVNSMKANGGSPTVGLRPNIGGETDRQYRRHSFEALMDVATEYNKNKAEKKTKKNKHKLFPKILRDKNKEYGLEDDFDAETGGNIYDALRIARGELCHEISDFDMSTSEIFQRRKSSRSGSQQFPSATATSRRSSTGMLLSTMMRNEPGFYDDTPRTTNDKDDKKRSASIVENDDSTRLEVDDSIVFTAPPASLNDNTDASQLRDQQHQQEGYGSDDSDEITA